MRRKFIVEDEDGDIVGYVEMDSIMIMDTLDLAITPIVMINNDGMPPVFDKMLLSKRTTLDIREREPEYPHRHKGKVVCSGSRPDEDETADLEQRVMWPI